MAEFCALRYFAALSLLVLYLKTLNAGPNSSLYFKNFGEGSNFQSQLALYGDAKVVNGGSSVQIAGSSSFSAGRLVYREPIKLVEGKPRKMASFSTYFSFSISPKSGDGLAFVMFPIGFALQVFDVGSLGLLRETRNRVFGVKFNSLKDDNYGVGDSKSNFHVENDINSIVSVNLNNVSSLNLGLNGGEKLQAWIDYDAGSRHLEVRLGKLGNPRPVDPMLSHPIDMLQVWKEEEEEEEEDDDDDVFVGLSSWTGNSSQKCNVYSWSFKLRRAPSSLHSQPLDPEAFSRKTEAMNQSVTKGTDHCVLKLLGLLVFGTACGALGAFIVVVIWVMYEGRHTVMVEEYALRPVKFEYEKFKVVVDKAVEDGGNK